MSKLKDFIILQKESINVSDTKKIFSLNKKRKKPLHPEEIQKRLIEKNNKSKSIGNSWKFPYGWKITLLDKDYVKHFRNTHSKATYLDAVRIRDEELKTGDYIQAWIVEKTNNTSFEL